MNYVCPKAGLIFVFCLITIFVAIDTSEANLCHQIDSCTCKGDNYTVNLTALASLGSPLLDTWDPEFNRTIHYKPCKSFTLGNSTVDGSCNQTGGVAVCVENRDGTDFKSWGTQLSARIEYDNNSEGYQITYTDNNRVVKVLLDCITENNSTLHKEIFTPQDNTYYLTLSSPYACDAGSQEDTTTAPTTTTKIPTTSTDTPTPVPTVPPHKLSTGSILVICFFVFLGVYLIGGMTYRAFCLGAAGLEMIPNYEFWSDFPVLVKDGFLYLFSCCQRETPYDHI